MLTMLASDIELDLVPVALSPSAAPIASVDEEQQRAAQLGRIVRVMSQEPMSETNIVQLLRSENYDAIVLPDVCPEGHETGSAAWSAFIVQNAPCGVFLASHPRTPRVVLV
jgi:hypothetical protein